MVLLPLAVLMAALGWWQIERMNARQTLFDDFANAGERALEDALGDTQPFASVRIAGRFDETRHVMLDNQVFRGQPGVHVFTPFLAESGSTILVNRGWQALQPDRRRLPAVQTPPGATTITGILAPPPEHRQRLGEADTLASNQWPQLVTYLDVATVADALQTELPERVVWLTGDHPAGFEGRDWSPAVMTPARHQAYAVQWFALAATALVIWLVLVFRGRAARPAEDAA